MFWGDQEFLYELYQKWSREAWGEESAQAPENISPLADTMPSIQPLPEELSAVDFDPVCEKRGCPSPATHYIEMHRVDQCSHPAFWPDRMQKQLVCSDHFKAAGLAAQAIARHSPGVCRTCGYPISHAGDVLRVSRRLDGKPTA